MFNYFNIFSTGNAITGSIFLMLCDSDLIKMGVPYGHILLLVRLIRELSDRNSQKRSSSSPVKSTDIIYISPQKRPPCYSNLEEIGSLNSVSDLNVNKSSLK